MENIVMFGHEEMGHKLKLLNCTSELIDALTSALAGKIVTLEEILVIITKIISGDIVLSDVDRNALLIEDKTITFMKAIVANNKAAEEAGKFLNQAMRTAYAREL